MLAATSDQAWLRHLLEFEGALARVESRLGVIPSGAGEAISARCHVNLFDIEQIGREGAAAGNPVIPLVRALTAVVPGEAAAHVHWGATSQDVLDTAMMLVARDGLELLIKDLERVQEAAAGLADKHRSTVMAARTLLQQALPTTFGLKAAGWLEAVSDAGARLREVRDNRLAVQLGGAAGTLAAFGPRGLDVSRALAAELGLAHPDLPWHTDRGRVAALAAALAGVAGSMAKIALDVALLSQTEVGEVVEPAPGGSSTLPHKRNPVGSALVRACARGVWAQVQLLTNAMEQEQERAAGSWQAEWPALTEAFRQAAGVVAGTAAVLEGLIVDEGRMRANLDAAGGAVMSEAVMMALAVKVGRLEAHDLVEQIVKASAGKPLRAALLADGRIAELVSEAELDAALEPSAYLGAAEELVDAALKKYRAMRSAHEKQSKSVIQSGHGSPA